MEVYTLQWNTYFLFRCLSKKCHYWRSDFFPSYHTYFNHEAVRVKEVITMSEIVSVHCCFLVKNWYSSHVDAARTVSLLLLPDPGVEHNTLILYLQDRRRIVISDVRLSKGESFCRQICIQTAFHEFGNEGELSQYMMKYASPFQLLRRYIDKIWRDSCKVPYPKSSVQREHTSHSVSESQRFNVDEANQIDCILF